MALPIKGWGLVLVSLAGCEDVIDLDPIDNRAPIEARVRPMPIAGGTLTLVGDGVAVAADPDRDLVYVVDLAEHSVRHTVALESRDEPGRVVLGSGTLAHVILRGFGGVATIDFASGAVIERRWLCPDPRGGAFDEASGSLHVACADGTLVQLPESGEPIARQQLEADLRDVVLVDGQPKVSRFRAATLVNADGSGVWAQPDGGGFIPHVAWNTKIDQWGNILMLHQFAATTPVPINIEADDLVAEAPSPYGGSGVDPCSPGIVSAAVTLIAGGNVATTVLPSAALTVDAALAPSQDLVALAMPGVEEGESTLQFVAPTGECGPLDELPDNGQITAVAFDPNGRLVAQSREPARILIQDDPPGGGFEIIELGGEPRYDSGHEIFHRATESGLSCASCHPEGGDDGHVWQFEEIGLRRTQTLDIGLADTAPFHWDGEMHDLSMIMDEVLSHRMGGKRQSPARNDSFARWMFEQERRPADTGREDPAQVADGAALFTTYDCGRCHIGPQLGGTTTEPILDTRLQVPSLRRVSLRPPFMHDGRSATLDDAVRDMIVTTTTAEPLEENVAALSAYMRTL